MIVNRPNELAAVHAAVCQERQSVHFVQPKRGYSAGIWEFADTDFRAKWWREGRILSNETIDCIPLMDILTEHTTTLDFQYKNKYFFDFFSLDIEGGELSLLSGVDFTSMVFGVIFLEVNADPNRNRDIQTLLEANGYTFVMEKARSLWFVHQDFDLIYGDQLLKKD
jgi:Methyltransferase FkbM domain